MAEIFCSARILQIPTLLIITNNNKQYSSAYMKIGIDFIQLGSAISIGREPDSCLGRVFNFKLDSFASNQHKYTLFVQPFIELKNRPRVRPVN